MADLLPPRTSQSGKVTWALVYPQLLAFPFWHKKAPITRKGLLYYTDDLSIVERLVGLRRWLFVDTDPGADLGLIEVFYMAANDLAI